jgi:predicted O-methyltransferase YrrM
VLSALRHFRKSAATAGTGWLAHVRWLKAWSRSLRKSASSVADESPWMTFGAIARLERHLRASRESARVFEWGSGGSTIFFARRAAEVVAVENDGPWAEKVRAALAERKLTHATVVFYAGEPEPGGDPADPEHFASASAHHKGETFRAYARHIENFPDGHFDVVVVDGRARPACLRLAIPKVKSGGLLVLDNSEREWYGRARALVSSWQKKEYAGPGPYCAHFWRTTIWQRPV